jgi:nucleoside-diphosphate-sugar epimerase
MRVLVTGASGFLGWRTSAVLAKAGCQVRALLHGKAIRYSDVPEGIEIAWAAMGDDSWHRCVLRDVDTVVHCAWDSRMYPDTRFRQTNIAGALKLFAAAEPAGVRQFIHISSVAVYGLKPLFDGGPMIESSPFVETAEEAMGPYPLAKVELERQLSSMATQSRMGIVILRPGLLFGGNRPPAKRVVRFGGIKVALVVGSGQNRLPYVHVDDVADAILTCINRRIERGAFNLVPSIMVPQARFLRCWARYHGLQCVLLPLPPWLVKLAEASKRQARRLFGRPVWPSTVNYQIATGMRDVLYSAAKAERELGWQAHRTLALLGRRGHAC